MNKILHFDFSKKSTAYEQIYRHTQSTPSVADIDAAAMEFERRFHISVDASEDREQLVIRHFLLFKHTVLKKQT